MKLENKTVLIVGASSGIGRATALALAARRNRVAVTARREAELLSLRKEIERNGGSCLALAADALDPEAAREVVARTKETLGRIDVAILNVGQGPPTSMVSCSAEEAANTMAVNYQSMVNYLVPVIDVMKEQRQGLVAHTNSLAGFLGLPMQGPYSAAKSAARILMDTCRIELAPHGIKFVSLHPGFVATERVAGDGLPKRFEMSESEAVEYLVHGIEREKADYLFPPPMRWLVRLAQVLPKRLTGYVLRTGTRQPR